MIIISDADFSGKSFLDIFNQTELTTTQKAGGVVSEGIIVGYDSSNKMNKLWASNLFGAGLKAGVLFDNSIASFKKKNNE